MDFNENNQTVWVTGECKYSDILKSKKAVDADNPGLSKDLEGLISMIYHSKINDNKVGILGFGFILLTLHDEFELFKTMGKNANHYGILVKINEKEEFIGSRMDYVTNSRNVQEAIGKTTEIAKWSNADNGYCMTLIQKR
jgi:hypothetical protein